MRRIATLLLLLTAGLLAACGADAGGTATASDAVLTDDYPDALSLTGQLALGTVQLDDTGLAVDVPQAETLLPLWQALQTLGTSDTAAQAELDGLRRQIERAMTGPQLEAIAAMALNTDSMAELARHGELSPGGFGRGGGAGVNGAPAATGGAFPARPEGFVGGGPGGAPGGGPGGRPGGGFGGGFGGEFPGTGTLSEDDIVTRQARFAGDEGESLALIGMVVRLLETKTGQAPALAGIPESVLAAVAALIGTEPADLQTRMADDATLTEIVAESGADPAAVRAAVIAALEALPTVADLDAAAVADRWLGARE